MKKMTARLVVKYLVLIGEELAEFGIKGPIRVMLLGGAFMLTQVKVKRLTDDIDVLPLDEEACDEETGVQLTLALRNAANEVARKKQLDRRWFNWMISEFVQAAGEVPTLVLWRKYGPLEVYLPPKEYIFTLKLMANREKDELDITELCKTLHIETREQAQQLIDKYIPDKDVQHFCAVHLTLNELFPAPKVIID